MLYRDTRSAPFWGHPRHELMGRISAIFHTGPKFNSDRNVSQDFIHSYEYLPQLPRGVKHCWYPTKWLRNRRGKVWKDIQAEPLPVLKTRSIGQPQLMSTKSRFPAHSFARISAVGTSEEGLFPAIWTPKIDSDGCLLTNDHSSFDPERNDWAKPTKGESITWMAIHIDTYSRHR